MKNPDVSVELSSTQQSLLREADFTRLTTILGRGCRQAVCGIEISVSSEAPTATASCNKCTDPKVTQEAVKLLPKLANAQILDSSLVDAATADALLVDDAKNIQMVLAAAVPDAYDDKGTLLIGRVSTAITSFGYVQIENDGILFPAKPANGQKLIFPGSLVLIERPL